MNLCKRELSKSRVQITKWREENSYGEQTNQFQRIIPSLRERFIRNDADQALCDEERHEGDWRRETRGEGGRVWKEKLEKSILSVLISRDCDGSGGHAAVIESC